MSSFFHGKTVIVTGASSGIGESIAREFARNGSSVMLAARSEDRLKRITGELRDQGYDAAYTVTDVSREENCKELIAATISRFGRLDILVNNAGISMRAIFTDVDLKVLQRLMEVNFWGTVYCTKYAIPYLIQSKGSLVAVSSVAGFHGLPGRTGYSASKFAIHGFMETIRIENLRNGLHVMVIAPGFTTSEIRRHALTANGSEQGDSPRPEEKLKSPGFVARKVLAGIRHKRRNMILTWDGKLTALFQRIVPRFVDWAYYKAMSKEPRSPLK